MVILTRTVRDIQNVVGMILLILMFTSEVWSLRRMELNLLEVWERTILRRIFGGVKVDGRRTKQELQELYGELSSTDREG